MIKRIALLVLPLLSACATPAQPEPDLIGTKWTFVSIDGKVPVSGRTSLTIEQGRIGANLGCNGMGSDLTIAAGRLMTNGVISTKMYCDGIMEQETAVGALLQASPNFSIDGNRLVLTSPGHRAELTRAN